MALRFLSGSNGFIPEATGQVIAFVRKDSEFALNKYVQYVPAPSVVGVYAELGRDAFVRRFSDEEFAWEDADERPKGNIYKVPFKWTEFRCFRRSYPWTVGYQAIDQTKAFSVKAVHAQMAASVAMTNRTKRVVSLIETAGNWAGNTADANVLNAGAGTWQFASDDPSSPGYLAIHKTLVEAARRIHLATNGKVKIPMLQLIVSPGLAITMSQTAEMVNYVRQTPQALQIVKEGFDPQYDLWGLPSTYKGFKLVVEDCPLVTESPKIDGSDNLLEATTNRGYAKADTSAVLASRNGALDGEYGAPSFSTIQLYHHKELLAVKAFDDPKNERVEGAVDENIKEVLAAPLAGYLITTTK